MIKLFLSHFFLFYLCAALVYCEEKPPMPVQVYMFYRRAEEFSGKADADHLRVYRLPTEAEKQVYLYSSYVHDFSGGNGRSDEITFLDVRRLCSWLIKDAPQENVPYVLEFIHKRNMEHKKIQDELLASLNKKKEVVGEAMLSLADLGTNAMPSYINFLKSEDEILYEGACWGIKALFKNKDISEETKRKWIHDLIEVIWFPSTPSRDCLIQQLLYLDQEGYAPMDIEDWVSICFCEKDIEIFEQVRFLYPEEYMEWQGKEGGFRKLIVE